MNDPCPSCHSPLQEGDEGLFCDNPFCDRWRLAEDFDAVFPPVPCDTCGALECLHIQARTQ